MISLIGKTTQSPTAWVSNAVEGNPFYKARRVEITHAWSQMIKFNPVWVALVEAIDGLTQDSTLVEFNTRSAELEHMKQQHRPLFTEKSWTLPRRRRLSCLRCWATAAPKP